MKLYYHTDRLGSVDYLSDNVSGKVASYIDYDAWGAPLKKSILKLGARELDLAVNYTGHPYDAVLRAYYAKARMYDANDRRFMAADLVKGHITDPQSMVRYTYCLDNPIIYVDPLGEAPTLVSDAMIKTGVGDNTINGFYYDNDTGRTYVSFLEALEAFGLTKDKGYAVTHEGYYIFSQIKALQAKLKENKSGKEFTFDVGVYGRSTGWLYYEEYSIIPGYIQDGIQIVDIGYFFNLMCRLGYNDIKVRPTSNHTPSCPYLCMKEHHDVRPHPGIDLIGDDGEPIFAAISGNVIVRRSEEAYWAAINRGEAKPSTGIHMAVISRDGTVVTEYKHLSKIVVSSGFVYAGTLIAKLGNTGHSTGPHLHFEVLKNGKHIDPKDFL